MTKAIPDGRNLALFVDGIQQPFIVEPLPARRGRALTELFVGISLGDSIPPVAAEAIFIEAVNPKNYARMTGSYVDQFDDAGAYVQTWSRDDSTVHEALVGTTIEGGARYVGIRDLRPTLGEAEFDAEPIRQEECESLSLCAFYWQSVVGIEAVNAFLEGGEGTSASLKALNLLLIRLGRSFTPSSLQVVTDSLTQQDSSSETTDTERSSASVPLPANKRGFLQNPAKKRRRRN